MAASQTRPVNSSQPPRLPTGSAGNTPPISNTFAINPTVRPRVASGFTATGGGALGAPLRSPGAVLKSQKTPNFWANPTGAPHLAHPTVTRVK